MDHNATKGRGGAGIRLIIERRILWLDARLPMATEPCPVQAQYWEGTCPACRGVVALWDDLGVMRTARHEAVCPYAGEAARLAKAWGKA
jgi:hypothetical protein